MTLRAYGQTTRPPAHLVPDVVLAWWVASLVVGVWLREPAVAALAAVGAMCLPNGRLLRWSAAVAAGLLVVAGSWWGARAWQAVQAPTTGTFTGWARVADDPVMNGRGVRIVLEIEGERFESWVYGRARAAVMRRQMGQWLQVSGTRRDDPDLRTSQRVRHIVGTVQLDAVGDWWEGRPAARSANRIREGLRRAAESNLPDEQAQVYLGLVIGDDARQPPDVRDAFRAAGLSHLTAVSGQNVAYVVAAASVLLRWLRPWRRWLATVAVISWFVLLTRAEPSVLRAGVMAALAATAHVRGLQLGRFRLLVVAVGGLVLVDPLLVWSVGFWLSVGATFGVAVIAPHVESWLPGPSWFRAPLAVTLGAQLGVAIPSVLVFGRMPISALWTNLLAVPVAGVVMLIGVPCGVIAALAPPLAPMLLTPLGWGVRWVITVARLGERLEPQNDVVVALAWVLVAMVVALLARVRMRRTRGRPVDVRH